MKKWLWKAWNRLKHFASYVRRYWTHYPVIEIAKKSTMLEPGKWYHITLDVKIEKDDIQVSDINVAKPKE